MSEHVSVNFFTESSKHEKRAKAFVLKNTLISEAAARKGIVIDYACGGGGTCGKCKVRVTPKDAFSEPDSSEKKLLKKDDIEKGIRLACRAKIIKDCMVYVADEVVFESAKILSIGQSKEISLSPCVHKKYLELIPADLERPVSDVTLLEEALGFTPKIGLFLLQQIPSILRKSSFKVTIVIHSCENEIIALEEGNTEEEHFSVAFDIGTTSVVGTLLDMKSGKEIAVSGRMNAQHVYGFDVISRIHHGASEKGRESLQNALLRTMNEIIADLVSQSAINKSRIYEISACGNTTMTHLLFNIPVESLSAIPFTPVFTSSKHIRASKIGLDTLAHTQLHTLPLVGGFVGGDTTGALLASGICSNEKPSLLVDIGTNGEVAIASKNILYTSSAPAGPAFEGAQIEFGMRGIKGAIEKVVFNEDVEIGVIGNRAPMGICGSGLIDVASELIRIGIVSETGEMLSPDEIPESVPKKISSRIMENENGKMFLLERNGAGGPIYISQKDIRQLQLAKGAISSVITMLLSEASISLNDLEAIYIAGAFGNYIRKESAIGIGLIPNIESEKVRFIGNAALVGSIMCLVSSASRTEIDSIAKRAKFMEFGGRADFQMIFAEAMLFPSIW